jgi:hypothetical protein
MLHRVKVLTRSSNNLGRDASVGDFISFVETLPTWAVVNAGNWLLRTFEDLLELMTVYPEFAQHLSASRVAELACKLGLAPNTLTNEDCDILIRWMATSL